MPYLLNCAARACTERLPPHAHYSAGALPAQQPACFTACLPGKLSARACPPDAFPICNHHRTVPRPVAFARHSRRRPGADKLFVVDGLLLGSTRRAGFLLPITLGLQAPACVPTFSNACAPPLRLQRCSPVVTDLSVFSLALYCSLLRAPSFSPRGNNSAYTPSSRHKHHTGTALGKQTVSLQAPGLAMQLATATCAALVSQFCRRTRRHSVAATACLPSAAACRHTLSVAPLTPSARMAPGLPYTSWTHCVTDCVWQTHRFGDVARVRRQRSSTRSALLSRTGALRGAYGCALKTLPRVCRGGIRARVTTRCARRMSGGAWRCVWHANCAS